MFRAFDMSMLVWEGEKNMLRLNYIYINNYNVFFRTARIFPTRMFREPAKSHAYPPVNSNIVMENGP